MVSNEKKSTAARIKYDADMKVSNIPLDKLSDNPFQARRKYPAPYIKSLANNITARGLQQPINVAKTETGYIIISGHCRVRAFRRLGRKTIPGIIRVKTTNKDLAIDLAIENAMRRDLDPIEKANEIKAVFSQIKSTHNSISRICSLVGLAKDVSNRNWEGHHSVRTTTRDFSDEDIHECLRLMKLMHVSFNTVSKFMRLLTLPKSIQERIVSCKDDVKNTLEAVAAGNIPATMGYELSRIKPAFIQKQLYDRAVKDKMSSIAIRGVVDEMLEGGAEQINKLGTSKRRLKDYGIEKLTQDIRALSSTFWNTRPKLMRIKHSLPRVIYMASLKKLKYVCEELIISINNCIEIDNASKYNIKKLKNEQIEVELGSCDDGRDTRRFTFPQKMATRLKLMDADKITLNITRIIKRK